MSILVKRINSVYETTALKNKEVELHNLKKIFKLNIVILIFIFLVLFFYLIEINQVITFGLRINELEKSKNNLQKINKELEIEKIKLESLSNAQNQILTLGFVKVDNLEYLRPMAGLTLTRK
ncbi:MAG: hypothetical protein KGZ97_11965 [Bacteroidetes bacterium]|nr:hypothetical protein [Bacteroidota bacterium]